MADGAAPVASIGEAMPIPRSFPLASDALLRAANPLQSDLSSAISSARS